MKTPTRPLVLWLIVFLLVGCTQSLRAAGDFVYYAGQWVVPRTQLVVQFYSEDLTPNTPNDDVIAAQFTIQISGVPTRTVVCANEAWNWETVKKTSLALVTHMEADSEINPIPLLTSLGLKGCKFSK